ncbi:MAG: hypothetical protein U0074_03020 [Kouleothrix sp.]
MLAAAPAAAPVAELGLEELFRNQVAAPLPRRSAGPIGQQQPEVFEALSLALHAVIDNHEPVDQALQSAQARLSEQLAQMSAPVATNIPPPVVSPVPEHAPPGVNALTFSAWGFDQEGLRRLGQAFNQANPDTFVQISEPTDNNSATQLDELPDTIDCFATPLLAGQSPDFGTLDLQPLIDADATFNLNIIGLEPPPGASCSAFRWSDCAPGL